MITRECATRPRFQRATLILLSSAFALALAGCGGSDDQPAAQQQPAPLPSPPTIPPLATGTRIVLNFGGSVGTTHHWPEGDTSTGGQGSDVDGIHCLPNMDETYHVHAHVSIFMNG